MATAVKNEKKEEVAQEVKPQAQAQAPELPQEVLQPVEDGNRDADRESRVAAAALVSLAETRAHRAGKMLDINNLEALKEEIGAIEDLLKKIARELA